VSNTTLNGWTSYGSGTKAATFTDCVFGKSSTGYANLRPYCDTTLTNCSFSEGFTITRNSPNNETFTITLTDCKVGNTVVTAANFEELFDDKSDDGKWALSTDGKITVIVDGVPVVW